MVSTFHSFNSMFKFIFLNHVLSCCDPKVPVVLVDSHGQVPLIVKLKKQEINIIVVRVEGLYVMHVLITGFQYLILGSIYHRVSVIVVIMIWEQP
jgi:hypothetical protein